LEPAAILGRFSEAFQRLREDPGIVSATTRVGNVWDNAAMKSFYSSMKTERVNRKTYRISNEARGDAFDHVENF
jgi:putative transposase